LKAEPGSEPPQATEPVQPSEKQSALPVGEDNPTAGEVARTRATLQGRARRGLVARLGLDPWVSDALTLVLALVLAIGCFFATMFVLDRSAVEDAVRLVLKRKTA
jgi:hypothetical protein